MYLFDLMINTLYPSTLLRMDRYIRDFSEDTAQSVLRLLSGSSRAPDVILARLPEFIRLFLSDGLLPDLVYALSIKNV